METSKTPSVFGICGAAALLTYLACGIMQFLRKGKVLYSVLAFSIHFAFHPVAASSFSGSPVVGTIFSSSHPTAPDETVVATLGPMDQHGNYSVFVADLSTNALRAQFTILPGMSWSDSLLNTSLVTADQSGLLQWIQSEVILVTNSSILFVLPRSLPLSSYAFKVIRSSYNALTLQWETVQIGSLSEGRINVPEVFFMQCDLGDSVSLPIDLIPSLKYLYTTGPALQSRGLPPLAEFYPNAAGLPWCGIFGKSINQQRRPLPNNATVTVLQNSVVVATFVPDPNTSPRPWNMNNRWCQYFSIPLSIMQTLLLQVSTNNVSPVVSMEFLYSNDGNANLLTSTKYQTQVDFTKISTVSSKIPWWKTISNSSIYVINPNPNAPSFDGNFDRLYSVDFTDPLQFNASQLSDSAFSTVSNSLTTAAQPGLIHLQPGTYYLNSTITLPDMTILRGSGQNATTIIVIAPVNSNGTVINKVTLPGVLPYSTGPGFLNNTIVFGKGFVLQNLTIIYQPSFCVKFVSNVQPSLTNSYSHIHQVQFFNSPYIQNVSTLCWHWSTDGGGAVSGQLMSIENVYLNDTGTAIWLNRANYTRVFDSYMGFRSLSIILNCGWNMIVENSHKRLLGNPVINDYVFGLQAGFLVAVYSSPPTTRDYYYGNMLSSSEFNLYNDNTVSDYYRGGYNGTVLQVDSSGTWLTLNGRVASQWFNQGTGNAFPSNAAGTIVQIIDGPGLGDYRYCTWLKNDGSPAGNRIQISSPFTVFETNRSVISLTSFRGRGLLVENKFYTEGVHMHQYYANRDLIYADNEISANFSDFSANFPIRNILNKTERPIQVTAQGGYPPLANRVVYCGFFHQFINNVIYSTAGVNVDIGGEAAAVFGNSSGLLYSGPFMYGFIFRNNQNPLNRFFAVNVWDGTGSSTLIESNYQMNYIAIPSHYVIFQYPSSSVVARYNVGLNGSNVNYCSSFVAGSYVIRCPLEKGNTQIVIPPPQVSKPNTKTTSTTLTSMKSSTTFTSTTSLTSRTTFSSASSTNLPFKTSLPSTTAFSSISTTSSLTAYPTTSAFTTSTSADTTYSNLPTTDSLSPALASTSMSTFASSTENLESTIGTISSILTTSTLTELTPTFATTASADTTYSNLPTTDSLSSALTSAWLSTTTATENSFSSITSDFSSTMSSTNTLIETYLTTLSSTTSSSALENAQQANNTKIAIIAGASAGVFVLIVTASIIFIMRRRKDKNAMRGYSTEQLNTERKPDEFEMG